MKDDLTFEEKLIIETYGQPMDFYTVKYINKKGNVMLGYTQAPRIKNSVNVAVRNFDNDIFGCKKVIGITPAYTSDINYPFFTKIE